MSSALDPERLMADAAWLHRLARRLADSEADADDLVQQTWITAWRRRPDTGRPVRPWLAKVARDLANMRRRGERRRVAREQAVELAEPSSPEELLERMRLHRALVDLVLALDEPYRSTVIWRYVEGRSAASIARSLGIPEATVRWRLREAVARLRAGLDARTGTRKAWAPALLAFARNGVIVTKTTKSVIVVLVLLVMASVAVVGVPRLLGGDAEPDPAAEPRGGGGAVLAAGTKPGREARLPGWFAIRNAAPRRIAGRVTFEDAPVAGAIVTLHSQLVAAGARAPERRTTGSDGRFDFGPQPVASYKVTAEVADRVPAIEVVELADPARRPAPDRLELRLHDCRSSLSGTIFDASGGFIARASVRREGLAGVVADEHGAYRLCVVHGQTDVVFSADGYGSVVLTVDVAGEQHRDVVLVPEGTITVRAVSGAGDPVAGAIVFAGPQEWGRGRPQTRSALTGDDGRARLDALVPGPYRVYGFAEDLESLHPVIASVEVGANPEVVLRLDAVARITGTVVAGGQPVSGATVVAIRSSPLRYSRPGYTAADGSFTVERVAPGDVKFSVFPYDVKSPATLHVEPGQTRDGVVLEVEALGSISGRVTRLGKPLEGVGVCCVNRPNLPARILTGADGRYEFRGVLEGHYQIGGGSDEIGAFAFSKQVTLARGEHATVDLELDQAAAISGTVVDKAGAPVPGVFVRWMHEVTGDVGRCTTDRHGRYRCAAMSGGGTYRAAVFPGATRMAPYPTADGAAYPTRVLEDAASTIDKVTIAIDYRRLAISGRVVDRAGAPIADAEVKALAVAEGQAPLFHSWSRLPRTFTGVDGSFAIGELATGTYALQARSADGGEATVANIAAGATGVTIAIERPGVIAGTLAGYSTPPVVDARPLHAAMRLLPAVVDGTRSFRIAGVRPGRYLVGAQTASEGDARIVEVRAGQTTKLTLTAQGRGVVEATVLDLRTRAPIANATCHAVMRVGGDQAITRWDMASATRSDARGRLVIDPAPAGPITVTCVFPTFRRSNPATDTVVPAGGRVAIELLSVELTAENPGSSGIAFAGWVTTPRVAGIAATSPARAAGLVVGDVVTAVNGIDVRGVNGDGVAFLIESQPVGSELAITVARGQTIRFIVPPHSS